MYDRTSISFIIHVILYYILNYNNMHKWRIPKPRLYLSIAASKCDTDE